NAGNVNVLNTPNVSVANTPTVRDQDNPARQPFQKTFRFTVPVGNGVIVQRLIDVPAGKRLVIEWVSASNGSSAANAFTLWVQNTTGGDTQSATFAMSVTPKTDISPFHVANETVRLYNDGQGSPGYKPLEVDIQGSGTGGDTFLTVSGYLVDL